MSNIRTLALLNLIIISLNFVWIVLLDSQNIFGHSIYLSLNNLNGYLILPEFSFKIWIFIAANMILLGYLMFRASQKEHLNVLTLKKIVKIGNLLIINQLFCGLSMVLKLNDYLFISILCTLVCIGTILIINHRIEIQNIKTNTILRYFLKLTFGLYLGWLIFVMVTNSSALIKLFDLHAYPLIEYLLNVFILVLSTAISIYYSYKKHLPTVAAVQTWGIFGLIYYSLENDIVHKININPVLYVLFLIISSFTIYNYIKCNVKQKPKDIPNQAPSSIP